MARIYSIGFETNSISNGIEANSITWNANTGMTIQTATVRTGTYALKDIQSGLGDFFDVVNSSSHSQYARIAFQYTASTGATVDILGITDQGFTTTIGQIAINTSNQLVLQYNNGSNVITSIGTSAALTSGQWYTIELYVDDTGGSSSTIVEGRLDGSVFATRTGAVGLGTGGVPSGRTSIGNVLLTPSNTGTFFYDDVAVNDSTGSNQTGYPGVGKLIALIPNAAGDVNTFATQTGGTAGSANNFTRVNEVTPDDATTFNGSSTLNQEDLFKCNDPVIGASDTVNCVHVMARYRNSTADTTGAFKIECEKAAAGTKSQSASIVPNSTTWVTVTPANSLVLYKDPDGGAWTETTLKTAQIGYKETTAPGTAGRRCDITKVWAYLDYTLAAVVASAPVGYKTLLGIGQV